MKRIHMTTSLGKDTSSAKTSRMTVYITGNHGLWVCKKRLRGSNKKFSAMRTFLESVRHLRHRTVASQGSVDFDSAETPLFSTQSLQESSVKERRKWYVKEDLILIGVWLNTSKDSIVGNEQKGVAFWKRIVEYYNSSPLLVGTVPRELGQCKQRWARINDLVCKFAGCYDTTLREQRSGQNDNDVMKVALDIFNSDQNMKFNLEHAWRELRHDVKWCSTYLEKDNDKRKTADTPVAEPEDRPTWVKAAKAAGKKKKTGKDEELTKLEGLMEMKKQISRQSLLERSVEDMCEMKTKDGVSSLFSHGRRFRMNKAVFMRIVDRLSENFPFFQQRRYAVRRLGLSSLQKCTTALRMLAYGCAADAVDEYLRLGTLNDINVLDWSPVFDDILQGRAPRVQYVVNGHQCDLAYYLTDGIYPKWSTFIQSISNPQGPKAELFANVQEATRKDVERAFGVLQARFAIVKNPAILWDKRQIGMVMRTCIILHNMIVENERNGYTQYDTSEFEEGDSSRYSQVDMSYSPKPSNLRTMLDIR
uniref:Myb-like domain-containing protein n=1 Tax=Brassica oleracea var. oleracea TaxID=109376 RepID=A0A0D3BD23_BRAOL